METQQQLVDLWLSCDDNTARIILKAFKIGVEEGRRCANGDPDTTLGVLNAFKEIMAMMPDEPKAESLNDRTERPMR